MIDSNLSNVLFSQFALYFINGNIDDFMLSDASDAYHFGYRGYRALQYVSSCLLLL